LWLKAFQEDPVEGNSKFQIAPRLTPRQFPAAPARPVMHGTVFALITEAAERIIFALELLSDIAAELSQRFVCRRSPRRYWDERENCVSRAQIIGDPKRDVRASVGFWIQSECERCVLHPDKVSRDSGNQLFRSVSQSYLLALGDLGRVLEELSNLSS
jgi:hypothetical protein